MEFDVLAVPNCSEPVRVREIGGAMAPLWSRYATSAHAIMVREVEL